MANPSLVLRGGPSGPTFAPSTPGYVLTVQSDGKSVAPAPGSAGAIDLSEVVNDSLVPGLTGADAVNNIGVNPNYPAEHDNGNSGATKTIDFSSGLAQKLTLTANCTLTCTGLVASRTQWPQLKVVQGGAGSFTLTIVGAKTPGGLGVTLSTAVGAVDLVGLYWDGALLNAQVSGLAFS